MSEILVLASQQAGGFLQTRKRNGALKMIPSHMNWILESKPSTTSPAVEIKSVRQPNAGTIHNVLDAKAVLLPRHFKKAAPCAGVLDA